MRQAVMRPPRSRPRSRNLASVAGRTLAGACSTRPESTISRGVCRPSEGGLREAERLGTGCHSARRGRRRRSARRRPRPVRCRAGIVPARGGAATSGADGVAQGPGRSPRPPPARAGRPRDDDRGAPARAPARAGPRARRRASGDPTTHRHSRRRIPARDPGPFPPAGARCLAQVRRRRGSRCWRSARGRSGHRLAAPGHGARRPPRPGQPRPRRRSPRRRRGRRRVPA